MGVVAMLRKSQAALYMILVQVFLTGMMLLSEIVLNRGLFVFALLTYRHIIATILLLPLAFFMERGMERKITWKALIWLFFNGLFGITMSMGLYYYGLRDTSATVSSTFLNIVPVVTFIFSVLFRIEKLGLKTIGGRIKVGGTILCFMGAIIFSLYKGKVLHIWPSHAHKGHNSTSTAAKQNIARGSVFLVGSCVGSAAWYLVQVNVSKLFPSTYWSTMISCLAGSLQSAIIGVALERRESAWKLSWDLNLLTIVYSGVLASGVNFCLIQWTVAHRGPTYPPMFNPLLLIFAAVLESLFMGEELFVGSILGIVLIIGGLYAFLWGKKKQLQANKVGVGGATLAPESTHSSTMVTPVSVGDVTLVLESHQASSTISPVIDNQDEIKTPDEASQKQVGISK